MKKKIGFCFILFISIVMFNTSLANAAEIPYSASTNLDLSVNYDNSTRNDTREVSIESNIDSRLAFKNVSFGIVNMDTGERMSITDTDVLALTIPKENGYGLLSLKIKSLPYRYSLSVCIQVFVKGLSEETRIPLVINAKALLPNGTQ